MWTALVAVLSTSLSVDLAAEACRRGVIRIMKIRTLVLQRRYFGLEARAFRTGVARALARVSPDSRT